MIDEKEENVVEDCIKEVCVCVRISKYRTFVSFTISRNEKQLPRVKDQVVGLSSYSKVVQCRTD